MEGKIRPQTVSEAVVERVLDDISAGQYGVEQRLPAQREMACQLGVSNSSVREALQSLQTMGVIEIRHGVGAFVLDQPHIRPMHKGDQGSNVLTSRRIEELMEARCVVEIGLACMAAERGTDEQIEELRGCFVEMTRAVSQNDGELYSEYDVRFHTLLAESSGNVLLSNFTHSLSSSLRSLIEFLPYSSAGLLLHRPILDGLRSRDPVAAAHAMAALMRHTVSLLQEQEVLKEPAIGALDAILTLAETSQGVAATALPDHFANLDTDTSL